MQSYNLLTCKTGDLCGKRMLKMIWQMTEHPTLMCRQSENMQHKNGSEVFVICAQIEQEISELDDDEKKNVPRRSRINRIRTGETDQSKLQSARPDQLPDCR